MGEVGSVLTRTAAALVPVHARRFLVHPDRETTHVMPVSFSFGGEEGGTASTKKEGKGGETETDTCTFIPVRDSPVYMRVHTLP